MRQSAKPISYAPGKGPGMADVAKLLLSKEGLKFSFGKLPSGKPTLVIARKIALLPKKRKAFQEDLDFAHYVLSAHSLPFNREENKIIVAEPLHGVADDWMYPRKAADVVALQDAVKALKKKG
ncbi:Uncharacterised protein [Candidatus Norongarragalina meridionalis]|nr:Uncharacterised protein [Candidatus Norongarragalina meridionalis]